jgi:preprotein translocase subunit SecA
MIRNVIGFEERLARLRGSSIDLDLSCYDRALAAIADLEPSLGTLSDTELTNEGRKLAGEARGGTSLSSLQERAFALVREIARRTVDLRPHDVQVVAGLALHEGKVVEMQTGEGKTLAAVMPAFLNALTGEGVHVLTFNDYLARRDAEWMGPIYRALGLSVAFVQAGMPPPERRTAYLADVTYVTAKEAGFDHLRDLLAREAGEVVHRAFHFALVDEADSILVDEARVPLVIAGSVERAGSSVERMAQVVAGLTPGADFDTDEYGRDVELTEAGIAHVEATLGCGSLHAGGNLDSLTELNCALHARVLLQRDVDYIVRDRRIQLVDEFTGRVVRDRHWPDGLHAALEAKEGLPRSADGRILGSIALQHFLGLYPRLCGMTGTTQGAAREVAELYGLRVLVVPTHRPVVRRDAPDVVFTHREAKEKAVVEEIRRVHACGRPLLVGTLTIEESERLAELLRASGIACEVLNAWSDAREARIVARAGAFGAVTISTNMAGRGTDIRLGGEDEKDRERVAALGGLYVIGTNRHESRRVDLQLRGRAGRQGDPGESRLFLSLEDDLLVRFGIRGLIPARFIPDRRDEPIDSPIVAREIARAQRIVEGQNLEIRKTLCRYAAPIEQQRRLVQDRRQALLQGAAVPDLWAERPERRAELVAAVGEQAVVLAETAVTLHHIDRAWADHLAFVADLREGIHLVGLGGDDPLTRFSVAAAEAFRRMQDELEAAVLDSLATVTVGGAGLDLGAGNIKGPSSTWTYLVNDDPFRDQMLTKLIGPGKTTLTIAAGVFAMPLLIAWTLVDRFVRKRRSSHSASGSSN